MTFEDAFAKKEAVKSNSEQEDILFVDVRTPKEFEESHVVDAINIPLLTNDQRHMVGLTYAKESKEAAIAKGWEIAGSVIHDLMDQFAMGIGADETSKPTKLVAIYCWRGGMRSRIVVNLLRLQGFNAIQLTGGYKEYMNEIVWKGLDRLSQHPFQFIVLFGNTGTRKTEILHELSRTHPVLDLEECAGHKGSLFGGINENPKSQKQFSTLCYHRLQELVLHQQYSYVFVEGEANKIGNVHVPTFIYQRIIDSKIKILVTASLECRIATIKKFYDNPNMMPEIRAATSSKVLNHNIGAKNVKYLMECLAEDRIDEFCKFLLVEYYDVRYGFARKHDHEYKLEVCSDDLIECSDKIRAFYDTVAVGN